MGQFEFKDRIDHEGIQVRQGINIAFPEILVPVILETAEGLLVVVFQQLPPVIINQGFGRRVLDRNL